MWAVSLELIWLFVVSLCVKESCFELTVYYMKSSWCPFDWCEDKVLYKYDSILKTIQVPLQCEKYERVKGIIVTHSIPKFEKDYCLGKNTSCKESQPCNCCTRPSDTCVKTKEYSTDSCIPIGSGACNMSIEREVVDGCTDYRCVIYVKGLFSSHPIQRCYTRWVYASYKCESGSKITSFHIFFFFVCFQKYSIILYTITIRF